MPEPVAPDPGATGSALPDAAISSGAPAIPTAPGDRLDWPAWLGSLPISEYGFPGPLRDKLLAALLSGAKTTTSSLHEGYQNAVQWRASHEAFWLSDASVEELGYTPQLSDDTLVVLETVRVIGAPQTIDGGDAAAR